MNASRPAPAAMPRSIILDCDPGHDDAIALFVAHGSPEIDLVAVTTVCGNQTVDKVTANALAVCSLAGMTDVIVARGADGPLRRAHRPAPDIHGESGLDGPPLPVNTMTLDDRTAAAVIVDEVMSRPAGSVTVVATAPLTNLALALRLEPAIAERASVAIMGGAIEQGNVTASAEFNILVDPDAAQEVFAAPWTVTMFGLEVTHLALATTEIRRRLIDIGSPVAAFADELLEFFGSTYADHQGFDAPPVHDLCPVVYLIDPSVFTIRSAPISVETEGEFTLGRTVVDLRPQTVGGRHRVATGLDVAKFWDIALDSIGRISI
ncbi:nucleoside hydrolase [Rhodococcoides trifolii]|uniref:nucleoside hydrolase n=1 Tax=Rhodococcoides trifolii TaxID=908250 RepID=UPI001E64E77D|nr:nucleoside hydrolase [Rhodococcus trifolii]